MRVREMERRATYYPVPVRDGGELMADALLNHIDGTWVDARDGARFDVFNPATGEVIATAPDPKQADVDDAAAAAVWTQDIKKALRTAQALRSGVVWINDTQPAPTEMPWGGYKQSGIGRELGKEGVEDFLEKKSVYLNLS